MLQTPCSPTMPVCREAACGSEGGLASRPLHLLSLPEAKGLRAPPFPSTCPCPKWGSLVTHTGLSSGTQPGPTVLLVLHLKATARGSLVCPHLVCQQLWHTSLGSMTVGFRPWGSVVLAPTAVREEGAGWWAAEAGGQGSPARLRSE